MVGPDKMWQYTTGGSHCWAAVMLQSSKGLTTTQRAAASEKSGVGASTGRKMLQDNHCNWRAPLTPQYTKNPLPPYMISTVDKCYCFATLCRNEMLCGQTNDIFRMKTANILVYFGGDQNYCSTIVIVRLRRICLTHVSLPNWKLSLSGTPDAKDRKHGHLCLELVDGTCLDLWEVTNQSRLGFSRGWPWRDRLCWIPMGILNGRSASELRSVYHADTSSLVVR